MSLKWRKSKPYVMKIVSLTLLKVRLIASGIF